MSGVTIEKGVPLPAPAGARNKYPWRTMEVGDSFFVANISTGGFGGTLAGAAARSGHRFTQRTVTENGVRGVRVWRIA